MRSPAAPCAARAQRLRSQYRVGDTKAGVNAWKNRGCDSSRARPPSRAQRRAHPHGAERGRVCRVRRDPRTRSQIVPPCLTILDDGYSGEVRLSPPCGEVGDGFDKQIQVVHRLQVGREVAYALSVRETETIRLFRRIQCNLLDSNSCAHDRPYAWSPPWKMR